MERVIRSPEAMMDIDEIGDTIARDSIQNAVQWLTRLDKFFHVIARAPGIGTARDEVRAGMRSTPFGNYVVFFRSMKGGVEIVRVIHGAREVEDEFGE